MKISFISCFLVLSVAGLPQGPLHLKQGPRRHRQSGLELLSIAVPIAATLFREPDQPKVKPVFDPSVPFSGSDKFSLDFEDFLSKPLQHTGRATQCTRGTTKQTTTTSRMNNRGQFRFVSEKVSNLAPGGGEDPQRPPTPPPRPTPQPRLNFKRKKDQSKNIRYIIRDPRQQQSDEEIEIVLLDDDDGNIVIPNLSYTHDDITEVPVPGPSRSFAVVTSTQTCPSSSAPSTSTSQPQLQETLQIISTGDKGQSVVQFTTSLPTLRPNPGSDRIPTAPNEPILPYWRGTIWGDLGSGVTNTCVMDSFFSHIIYISRRYPRYFRIHLNLANNRAETFILFLSRNTNLRASIFEMSNGVHKSWIRSITPGLFPTNIVGDVDMASRQHQAVITHMPDSCRMWFIYQCQCDTTSRSELDRFWRPSQLHIMNKPEIGNPGPQGAVKTCGNCQQGFRYTRGLVSQATWFHSFRISIGPYSRDQFPRSIQMQEIGTNAIVHFDIGYFLYNTRGVNFMGLGHQTSVHWIEGEGYRFYDCTTSNLGPIPANLDQDNFIEAAVYFRRYDETRPR